MVQALYSSETDAEKKPHLDEPDRIIHTDDLMRLTIRFPDHAMGVLEKVQKNGEVATPDGSMIKAAGLKLKEFRSDFLKLYADLPTYEGVKVEAYISSSPYAVIKLPEPTQEDVSKKARVPRVFRKIFQKPTTLWDAIQEQGGIPPEVDPSKIRILKRGLVRKTFDCHLQGGLPDGKTLVESGDYIFLVPADVPVSQIFDEQ